MIVKVKIEDSEGEKRENTWIVNDKLSETDKKRVIRQIEDYLGEFIR